MTPTGGNPVGGFFYAADSARRGVTDKFFGFFRLLDACAQSGCPACRLVEDDGRRYLDALVYEQVNDPGTRRCIRAARDPERALRRRDPLRGSASRRARSPQTHA